MPEDFSFGTRIPQHGYLVRFSRDVDEGTPSREVSIDFRISCCTRTMRPASKGPAGMRTRDIHTMFDRISGTYSVPGALLRMACSYEISQTIARNRAVERVKSL